jgi:tRNA nucleotidyltransferase (CCA-adding enzyme)
MEEQSVQMMARLSEINLLEAIHPDLVWDEWIENKISHYKIPSLEWGIRTNWKGIPVQRVIFYALWLIRIPWNRSEKIIKRLRLPRAIRDVIKDAHTLWVELPTLELAKPSDYVHLLDKNMVLSIYTMYLSAGPKHIREALHTYITRWKQISPTITGHDLRDLGLPPGPEYKKILNKLRDAWLDKEIQTQDQERQLLKTLIKQYFSDLD